MGDLRATLIRLVRESTEEVDRRRHTSLPTEALACFQTGGARHQVPVSNVSLDGAFSLPPGACGTPAAAGCAPIPAIVVDATGGAMRVRFQDVAASECPAAALGNPAAGLRAA
jgi:hypothetical protein